MAPCAAIDCCSIDLRNKNKYTDLKGPSISFCLDFLRSVAIYNPFPTQRDLMPSGLDLKLKRYLSTCPLSSFYPVTSIYPKATRWKMKKSTRKIKRNKSTLLLTQFLFKIPLGSALNVSLVLPRTLSFRTTLTISCRQIVLRFDDSERYKVK